MPFTACFGQIAPGIGEKNGSVGPRFNKIFALQSLDNRIHRGASYTKSGGQIDGACLARFLDLARIALIAGIVILIRNEARTTCLALIPYFCGIRTLRTLTAFGGLFCCFDLPWIALVAGIVILIRNEARSSFSWK